MLSPAGLPFGLSAEVMTAATAEPDPDSLAAGARLRERFGPELAARALHQVSLRRRARVKFGAAAAALWFTRAGLEQATRPEIAEHHARRLLTAGARRVVDLGCGLGTDALAFARAGLEVLAVEIDPETAAVAAANLGALGHVVCADAADAIRDLSPSDAVFLDPSRRGDRGRLWRVEDFTPDWGLVTGLLTDGRVAGVKLGPALPHSLIPEGVEAEWVTHRHEVVEAALWAGPGAVPERRSALVWPDDRLVTEPTDPLPVGEVGDVLFEPDGSVIRAGGLAQLGLLLGAHLVDPKIAYLSGDTAVASPFATAYAVIDVLPYRIKTVKPWLREHDIGTLEIKKRGVEVDPAALRTRLDLRGSKSATMIISRTPPGAIAIMARRTAEPSPF